MDRQTARPTSTPSRTVCETQIDSQNMATSSLGSGHGGGLANGKKSMNAASCVRVLGVVHSDDPSREDALEEHSNPKMDVVLQAA